MKTKTVKIAEVNDFDELVMNTYGIPYNFQQQGGCKNTSIEYFCFPFNGDYTNTTLPFEINGKTRGISFEVWKNHDMEELKKMFSDDWEVGMFYARNFYPHIERLLQDLVDKELISGKCFGIEINR